MSDITCHKCKLTADMTYDADYDVHLCYKCAYDLSNNKFIEADKKLLQIEEAYRATRADLNGPYFVSIDNICESIKNTNLLSIY